MEVESYGKRWDTGWELLHWCCLFVKFCAFFACFSIIAWTVWFWSPFFLTSSLIIFLKSLKFPHFLRQIAHEAVSVVTARKTSICSFFSSPLIIYRSLSGVSLTTNTVWSCKKTGRKLIGNPNLSFRADISCFILFLCEKMKDLSFLQPEVTQLLPIHLDSWWAAAGPLFVSCSKSIVIKWGRPAPKDVRRQRCAVTGSLSRASLGWLPANLQVAVTLEALNFGMSEK